VEEHGTKSATAKMHVTTKKDTHKISLKNVLSISFQSLRLHCGTEKSPPGMG